MPIKTAGLTAFPCLACIREQGRPDNDSYVELARIVICGEISSVEVWSLLRKREDQNRYGMIPRIVACMDEKNAGLDEKCDRIALIIHDFGFPKSEDQHTCER